MVNIFSRNQLQAGNGGEAQKLNNSMNSQQCDPQSTV